MTPLDDFQKRYLDELEAAASVLPTLESAAQAEAWASGAVAEWHALSGPAGALVEHLAGVSPLAAELIRWFEGGDRPDGDDPEWVRDLGRSELSRVVRVTQPDSPDEIGIILEYSLDGQPDHDVSVSLEHGHITGITVGPTGLIEGITHEADGDNNGLAATEVDLGSVESLISNALDQPAPELSAVSEANIPLLVMRLGVSSTHLLARTRAVRIVPAEGRDREAELWCVEIARSGLRAQLAAPAPETVDELATRFASRLLAGDPDALTLLEVAGVSSEQSTELETLLDSVGAYFAPVDLSAHSQAGFDALVGVEPVDWLGVVLGLVRSPADAEPLDGNALVTFINRAPEITTTISRRDAPMLAWTFDQMLFAWEVTGVISGEGAVTQAGRWLVGQAFVRALS